MMTTKIWNTPHGYIYTYSSIILDGYHVLIGGASGSGKSVLINRLMYDALMFAPCEKQFILIDSKRVELSSYKNLPHCLYYGNDSRSIENAVNYCYQLMQQRFQKMERQGIRKYDGSIVYLVIDEYTDIKYNYPSLVDKIVLLSSMGRASNIIVILATQRPTRDILSGAIQCNFSTRIGLRTDSKQDSKNIIQCYGCEALPLYGYAYLKASSIPNPQMFEVNAVTDEEIKERVAFWIKQK